MKKTFIILLIANLTIISNAFAQSVGINSNGATPEPSAMLDVSSSSQGILIPRMTLGQRNAIANPASGLMIYQTDNTQGFYYYEGGWQFVGKGLSFSDISSKPTTIAGYGITDGATKSYVDSKTSALCSVYSLGGAVSVIPGSSPITFAGPTQTVVLSETSIVTASITAILGVMSGTATTNINYMVAYQNTSGGSITFFNSQYFLVADVSENRTPFSSSYSVSLPAGTYRIGLAVVNNTVNPLNHSDYLHGFVMVTKP